MGWLGMRTAQPRMNRRCSPPVDGALPSPGFPCGRHWRDPPVSMYPALPATDPAWVGPAAVTGRVALPVCGMLPMPV